MKHSSLGEHNHVVSFVDDYTRLNILKFVKKKNDTTATLLSLIEDYITSQELSIKCIRTDNGGTFEVEFQCEWTGAASRTSITHHTRRSTKG